MRRAVGTLVTIGAIAALPVEALASGVTLGPQGLISSSTKDSCGESAPGCLGLTITQVSAPEVIARAPASGVITSWSVFGGGRLKLRVLEPDPNGLFIGDGTSAVATRLDGQPNEVHLPIRAGEAIGVDLDNSGSDVQFFDKEPGGDVLEYMPPLADGSNGEDVEIRHHFTERVYELSAEETFAPVLTSISPAAGSPTGGYAVKLAGRYFDGATGVTFGSVPASSFSVDSSSQITAIAPPSAEVTGDVRVSGPGGSSDVSVADRFTFGSPQSTLPGAPLGEVLVSKPVVSGITQSASRWRRGRSLPHISRAGTPVGTTFGFTLNETANVRLGFERRLSGRRVHGRCVGRTASNAGKPKCKRTVSAGSVILAGHTGSNVLRFQGRVSVHRTLAPGTYAVAISAQDSRGIRSAAQSLRFTIVAG